VTDDDAPVDAGDGTYEERVDVLADRTVGGDTAASTDGEQS
jgi:hypothetical protein